MMKRSAYILTAAAAIILAACTPQTVEQPTDNTSEYDQMIMQVRGSDRLYTTEYVVHKIVTYDDIVRLQGSVLSKRFDIRLPQGDRKVLIPMEARIKAYIDFSAFGPNNVIFNADSTSITVILPDPSIELTSTKIDHAGIKTFVDMGRKKFSNAELADFEAQGRAAIISSIPRMGIEQRARTDAYNFLVPIISKMGYSPSQITVTFRKDFSDSDYLDMLIDNVRRL